jgi:hypothetical protein
MIEGIDLIDRAGSGFSTNVFAVYPLEFSFIGKLIVQYPKTLGRPMSFCVPA